MTPVHVPASLRVGAAIATGLLVAASTLATPASAAPANIAGMIVFLDPGHNGANDASISRQVPTGRGGTKDCQASGTSTDDGYPEHTFTWDTTLRIRQALTALGVRTAMSRGDDTGLGPCVDERAAMANSLQPNAVVSIHADGGPPTGRGFHVLYSSPPLNDAQAGPSVQFAQIMRDQLAASGIRAVHLHRLERAQPALRHRRAQPGAVPVDPGRAGQHEEPRRFGADEDPRGPAEVRRRRGARYRGLPGYPARRGPASRPRLAS